MTTEPHTDLDSLRRSLRDLRQDAAKIIAAMQLGGARSKRREQSRQLAGYRKRAKALAPAVESLLAERQSEAGEALDELQKASRFLSQLQRLGVKAPDAR